MSDQNCLAADASRRLVMKAMLAVGLSGFAGADLTEAAHAADAAQWPTDAFAQKSEADAIKSLFGKTAEKSDQVLLDAPAIAENGAVVPITISTKLPDVTSMALLVTENPLTLAAMYKIPPGTTASVGNRVKMAKTSNVVAVIEAGGKLYTASKEVKVTVGGCGG